MDHQSNTISWLLFEIWLLTPFSDRHVNYHNDSSLVKLAMAIGGYLIVTVGVSLMNSPPDVQQRFQDGGALSFVDGPSVNAAQALR